MKYILSISISVLSVIIEIGLIIYYYTIGGLKGLEGAGFVLAILGAPTTLLDLLIYKLGLNRGFIQDFVWICFFYFLQYQIIALLIYKPSKKIKIFIFAIIFIIFIISASLVYYIAIGKYENMKPIHSIKVR